MLLLIYGLNNESLYEEFINFIYRKLDFPAKRWYNLFISNGFSQNT